MMLKTLGLVAGLVVASVVPAAAQSMCSEPIPPATVDGSKVTREQLHQNFLDVSAFIKASDDYQDCVNGEYRDAVLAARKANKDLDPAITDAHDSKIKENQALKEKVGAEYNAAATAYKNAHPGT